MLHASSARSRIKSLCELCNVKCLSLLLVDSLWWSAVKHCAAICAVSGLVCFGTSGRGQSDVPHASVTGYRPYEAVACGLLALQDQRVSAFNSWGHILCSMFELRRPGHLHTCAATVTGQLVYFGDNSFSTACFKDSCIIYV